jgi:hypothetical protein
MSAATCPSVPPRARHDFFSKWMVEIGDNQKSKTPMLHNKTMAVFAI